MGSVVAREWSLQSSKQLKPQIKVTMSGCIPVTDKGVDWGVEILGVPKEERVLMCTKVRD